MRKIDARVVVLVALSRAGKDTAAGYLAKKYGFFRVGFSDMLKAELSRLRLVHSKENMVRLGNDLRRAHGNDIVARLAVQKAVNSRRRRIVFSGARSPEEIRLIRRTFARTLVLAIQSDVAIRQSRALKAGWSEKNLSAKDHDDIEHKGLRQALSLADGVVENNSTRRAFNENLDFAMSSFRLKRSGQQHARRRSAVVG